MRVRLWWFFVPVLVWAIAVTVFLFVRNPLPFPDQGHRLFAVQNENAENAANVVATILGRIAGLQERFTFDAGPTIQTLLWDNTTVIIQHKQAVRDQGFAPNAISVVVSNPKKSALEAADMLRQAGFTAIVHADVMPELGDKLVLLESNAFDGWVMVFRRHILAMGAPPNKRKLLK